MSCSWNALAHRVFPQFAVFTSKDTDPTVMCTCALAHQLKMFNLHLKNLNINPRRNEETGYGENLIYLHLMKGEEQVTGDRRVPWV